MSGFLKLNIKDVSKGAVVAVIVAVLGVIQQAFQTHGIDVVHFDWLSILDVAWKTAGAYLVKNLLSTEDGKVLGRIG